MKLISESISIDTEKINNNIVVLKFVLLVEVAVTFAFPEAASAHVEARLSLLKHYKSAHKLEFRSHYFLHLLDDFLRGAVDPLLSLPSVISNIFELFVYECVDFVLDCLLNRAEGDFFFTLVCHISGTLVSLLFFHLKF